MALNLKEINMFEQISRVSCTVDNYKTISTTRFLRRILTRGFSKKPSDTQKGKALDNITVSGTGDVEIIVCTS